MKCPNCEQQPISPVKFFIKLSPRKLKCKKCGTVLTLSPVHSVLYVIVIVIAVVLGFWAEYKGDGQFWLILLGYIVIIALPVDLYYWFHGNYRVKDQ